MQFKAVKYSELPPRARQAWDAIWRRWAEGSPDTCDREEAAAILRDLDAGHDPSDSYLGEDARQWASDGEHVAMFQHGAVLRSSHIFHWFDGERWLVDADSAAEDEMTSVIEDWDEWGRIMKGKILPALAEAFPGEEWG